MADIDATLKSPIRFAPEMEVVGADEAAAIAGLVETLTKISETTFAHSGHATRGVHAKSHGVLRGEMTVLEKLSPGLAQGVFARQATYPVVMRLSTLPGDILDDAVSTPRGLAVKIIGVEGERLPGSEGDVTQDFVLVNGPAFGAATAQKFLPNLKLVAATTDRAEGLKKLVSAFARVTEALLEAFGTKSSTILTLGGQPETHILGETFYSQAPVLYGPYMAKVAIAPVSPALKALTGTAVHLSGRPDGLREAVREYFATLGGEWEIRVQLCNDLQAMPIEDASVVWPETLSPFVAVARISVKPQDSWAPAEVAAIEDGLAFSPWHGLAAHRPLGSVMRARRATYESSARFRGARNGCPMHEPKRAGDVAGGAR